MVWMSMVLLGCGTNNEVFERYDAAKRAAMKQAAPPTGAWVPDLRIELSPPLLDRLVRFGLDQNGPFESEVDFSIGRATPSLTVKKLVLSPSNNCEQCFTVDLDLEGEIRWRAGVLGQGQVPATAKVQLDVEVLTERSGEKWLVKGLPRDVRRVSLAVPGWSAGVRRAANAPLERWLNEKVEQIKPVTLTSFGGEDLPLVAVAVQPRGRGLSIRALTNTPMPGLLRADGGQLPKTGFAVWVGYQTLVGFAARKAYEEGPQDFDVVAVPTLLTSKKAGFTLGLRLWGLGGGGWWRDYSASGGIAIADGEVRLKANTITQLKASPNAIKTDPLAYLAEGVILDAMGDAMRVSLPNIYRKRVGSAASSTSIHSIRGGRQGLRVAGELSVGRAKGKPGKSRR